MNSITVYNGITGKYQKVSKSVSRKNILKEKNENSMNI